MLNQTSDGDMTRALLTDGERSALEGDQMDDSTRSSYKSRVRKRVNNRLADDIRILRQNDPELYDSVRKIVCEKDIDEQIAELRGRIDELESKLEEHEQ